MTESNATPSSRSAQPVMGFCRNCGRAIAQGDGREWQGSLHCNDCIEQLSGSVDAAEMPGPADQPAKTAEGSAEVSESRQPPLEAKTSGLADRPSPVLALILGIIPGVGAVYNRQYAKGVAHVVVFGGIVSLLVSEAASGLEPLFFLLALLMFFYMPLEAFRTAQALEQGSPVEELSGFLSPGDEMAGSPALGITLIVVGVVFLLHSLGYWRIANLLPYWPVILIVWGAYLLYRRITQGSVPGAAEIPSSGPQEQQEEPQPSREGEAEGGAEQSEGEPAPSSETPKSEDEQASDEAQRRPGTGD